MSPEESRRLGFPWSEQLRERSLRTGQATIEAARDGLERGAGVTLAGGTLEDIAMIQSESVRSVSPVYG